MMETDSDDVEEDSSVHRLEYSTVEMRWKDTLARKNEDFVRLCETLAEKKKKALAKKKETLAKKEAFDRLEKFNIEEKKKKTLAKKKQALRKTLAKKNEARRKTLAKKKETLAEKEKKTLAKKETLAEKTLHCGEEEDAGQEEGGAAEKKCKMGRNNIYSRAYHKFLRDRGFKKPKDADVETRKKAATAGRAATTEQGDFNFPWIRAISISNKEQGDDLD